MNEKKARERIILNKIYNDTNTYVITYSEKPDFIIKNKILKEKFGVEITELYYNQSSARLKNIPNYVYNLLRNGIPRKDVGVLNKHLIYADINGKWQYLGDTIGLSFKKSEDYINALISTIKIKNQKFEKYQKVDYIELFIDDKENYMYFKNIKEVNGILNSKKIIDIIDVSPFKRIYLFTIIDKKECLIIFGDLLTGPLKVTDKEIKAQNEFIKNMI